MQHARKTLSIRPATAEPVLEPEQVLRRAIDRKVCFSAVYNHARVKLAPHILYTRHDDPFVDAMVVERDGRPPREVKLGTFKLAGLREVRITPTPFMPLPGFDAAAPGYEGATLQAVQR